MCVNSWMANEELTVEFSRYLLILSDDEMDLVFLSVYLGCYILL